MGDDRSCINAAFVVGGTIEEIKCGGDSSCSGASLSVSCSAEKPCKVECDGDMACSNANIEVSNTEGFICGTDFACQDATVSITDPQDDFKLECKGKKACENLQLTIELSAASTLTELDAISCDDEKACKGASITIINNSPNPLVIEELNCADDRSCINAAFVVQGTAGVSIEECDCGDEGGCDGATGLAAICDNIAATGTPNTPSPVAAVTPAPTEVSFDNETDSNSSSSDWVSFDSDSFDSESVDDNSTADGSVVMPFAALAQAVGSESDTVSGLLSADGDSDGEHVMISLSKQTLENLWGLCAVVLFVNIALCAWCQCKRNKAAKQQQQRFVSDDPYVSEVNANV